MLAIRYFSYILSLLAIFVFLPISFSLFYFIYSFSMYTVRAYFYPFFLYSILFSSTRFPCSLYQRGWDCTARWISPCVGVSLCVDVRLCRVSSCTWPDGDALVSRGLVPGV